MPVRRVQGFNVPYSYPDHKDIAESGQTDASRSDASSQAAAEKPSEDSLKQTSHIAELNQEASARSKELNSQFESGYQNNQAVLEFLKQSKDFKGEIDTIEPHQKKTQNR
jgi:hypothetical protein